VLWVHEDHRDSGLGSRLMEMAEDQAKGRGCHSSYLNTFSYQARPFYERLGYVVFGTLTDFPKGHERYYMMKRLS
jgi:GNAT superfamily N-acetyltransferase